ncbi:hypothetical protein Sjap_022472 [Stephania japonica]|uniref:Beta-glucosidase n=1 Tax=Stephania japonica TaxID=461633 RepID=A0AAP0HV13_9MAGN
MRIEFKKKQQRREISHSRTHERERDRERYRQRYHLKIDDQICEVEDEADPFASKVEDEDVKWMNEMGLDAYRFSISWSRLIPDGHGAFNPKGVDYYNNLINELVSYDIPQSLQDEYDGYLSPSEDFTAYANICFKGFGDRVKHWTTFNEPNIQTISGNDFGIIPPSRCSYPFGVTLARKSSYCHMHLQYSFIEKSIRFLDPVVYSDYPTYMKNVVGSRLPLFTENDSKLLKSSYDFIGINHYLSLPVEDSPITFSKYGSDYVRDTSAKGFLSKSILRRGRPTLPFNSQLLQRLLEYVNVKYKNPAVVIHENGFQSDGDNCNAQALNDTERIEYLQSYIGSLILSIRNGSAWISKMRRGRGSLGCQLSGSPSSLPRRRTMQGYLLTSSLSSSSIKPAVQQCECILVIVGVHLQLSNGLIISRSDFPTGFVFGAGSSAYQIEGAAAEDGRKPSIWDTFTHTGKTVDKSSGDIASDQYHHYKEDVKLMHKTGLDAYRFSISWSRLIPDGHGAVNPKGLDYYNNLINELVSYGIEPHITLSHLDIPQSLQDEYDGYLSPKFIEDFTAYADVCFKEFGDRVKHWITFNEPNIQTIIGNEFGIFPPSRCSYPFGVNCSIGNSATEPYIGAHTILLSHASAVQLYREKYQGIQRGQIGITILAVWFEPVSDSPKDIAAKQRMLDFHIGWFLDPLVYGDYPASMKNIVGSRLPLLTENDSKQLKSSCDFIGLNHYFALTVGDLPRTFSKYETDYVRDTSVKGLLSKSMLQRDSTLPSNPRSLQRLLEYVNVKYKNPAVVIHENGLRAHGDNCNAQALNDTKRIEYMESYIESLLISIRNGSDVRGYFVWSFMDCFELTDGYRSHYGLYAVDFNDAKRKRYPRMSAKWFSSFLAKEKNSAEISSY